jgi:hypothetical protein
MTDVINGKVTSETHLRTEYFECSCHSADHTVRIMLDPGDIDEKNPKHSWPPEVYIEVQLGDYPNFFRRAWRGLKYVFGYKSKYGHWDTTILKHEDIPRLRNVLDQYDKLVDDFEKRHQSTK